MMMRTTKFIGLIAVLMLMLSAVVACRKDESVGTEPKSPDFHLKSLKGERFRLSQRKSRIVVCAFWSTYCVVCKKELLDFNDWKKRFKPEDVEFVGICCDPENLDSVKEIVEQYGLESTILLDAGAAIGKKFDVTEYPVTVIVRGGDRIVYRKTGYDKTIHDEIRKKLETLVLEDE